jgi:hypothetical protein
MMVRQGAVPRAQEERASPGRDLRLGQSVHGKAATIAFQRGVVCLRHEKSAWVDAQYVITNHPSIPEPVLFLNGANAVPP